MQDAERFDAELDKLNQAVVDSVPELSELWCRPDEHGVVDLRLQLEPDSWDARERAIDAMLKLRRDYIGEISINYSFTLPDVAFEARHQHSSVGAQIYSFA